MTRIKHWLMVLALPLFLAVVLIAGRATAAFAVPAYHFNANDTGTFMNGWSGGPAVDSYDASTVNDDFTLNLLGTYIQLTFEPGGSGTYVGDCIGDYGNSQSSARVGLTNCDYGTPWGANLVESQCYVNGLQGSEFKDVHWGGYLGPSGYGNGSAYYLNKPTPTCFVVAG